MPNTEYSLFRIKFVKPNQTDFTHEQKTSSEFFLESLKERPSYTHRERFTWHIGNLFEFSPLTGTFAIGRTSKSTVELFDEKTKNFQEAEFEESPNTTCLYDAELGILVIAEKSILNQDTVKLAEKIEQLLTNAEVILMNDIRVDVDPIPDPDGFIKRISSAHQIFRFTATFGGPNPFDADEHFQKPLSVYLSKANGTEGKAIVKGESLNSETIAEVSKSTAATGNQASARIKRFKSSKAETVHLKGDPVKRRLDEGQLGLEKILGIFIKLYHDIRN